MVPACPALPSNTTRSENMPTIALTTPSGAARSASNGPCSMWASTYAPGGGTSQPAAGGNRKPRLGQRLRAC